MKKRTEIADNLKKYDISRVDLERCSLHDLRTIGQCALIGFAVKMKKNELVEELLLIKEGKEAIHIPETNKGRPSNALIAFDGAMKVLIGYALKRQASSNTNADELDRLSDIENFDCENLDKNDFKEEIGEELIGCGVLDICQEGYGFLRRDNFYQSRNDIYIHANQIKSLRLRKGDFICGKLGHKDGMSDRLVYIDTINGLKVSDAFARPDFDDLTPIYPNQKINLELENESDTALRAIDLLCPIGKGQRAMIVAPPKAGKTTIMKKVAKAISQNHKEIKLFVLLVDERPEEVTDFKQSIDGVVVSSTFDESFDRHVKVAELLLAHAKRLVECGQDVCIIMDSITRLARASNKVTPTSGRSLSGGLDINALSFPKKFFGGARNIENGGSLTIVATALVESAGNKMDDIIYEEFKGTGNMELHLSRNLAEKQLYPAIDINRSSTRMDNLIQSKEVVQGVNKIRRLLASKQPIDGLCFLLDMIDETANNTELLGKLAEFASR